MNAGARMSNIPMATSEVFDYSEESKIIIDKNPDELVSLKGSIETIHSDRVDQQLQKTEVKPKEEEDYETVENANQNPNDEEVLVSTTLLSQKKVPKDNKVPDNQNKPEKGNKPIRFEDIKIAESVAWKSETEPKNENPKGAFQGKNKPDPKSKKEKIMEKMSLADIPVTDSTLINYQDSQDQKASEKFRLIQESYKTKERSDVFSAPDESHSHKFVGLSSEALKSDKYIGNAPEEAHKANQTDNDRVKQENKREEKLNELRSGPYIFVLELGQETLIIEAENAETSRIFKKIVTKEDLSKVAHLIDSVSELKGLIESGLRKDKEANIEIKIDDSAKIILQTGAVVGKKEKLIKLFEIQLEEEILNPLQKSQKIIDKVSKQESKDLFQERFTTALKNLLEWADGVNGGVKNVLCKIEELEKRRSAQAQ